MKIYFCSGCGRLWKLDDLKPIATRGQLKHLGAFKKKYPNREALGACSKCGRPVCEFPDVAAPADTSMPAETSMASFDPDKLNDQQRGVTARLLEIRKKGKLGATRDEMIAHLHQRYSSVSKTLSVLMRLGVAVRTIIRVKNPDTGKMNAVYAICPEVIQARKDGLFAEDFKRIQEDNLSLKFQQKELIRLEEKRNEDLERLRRKCYAHYASETASEADDETDGGETKGAGE